MWDGGFGFVIGSEFLKSWVVRHEFCDVGGVGSGFRVLKLMTGFFKCHPQTKILTRPSPS